MWDWKHLKDDGWFTHTKRSARFSALLLVSGLAMILHMLIPFWQQPKVLQRGSVSDALCPDKKIEAPQEHLVPELASVVEEPSAGHWIDSKGRLRPARRSPGIEKKE